MGLKCTDYFETSKYDSPDIQIITCKSCSSHLCLSDLILSDNFSGSTGPAYLVDNLINVQINPKTEDTQMKTGAYKINKVECHQCLKTLGWYYKKSYSYSETYKEGKFVIEKSFIKFSDNLSTTQLLKEKAMQSKFRRFSNSSSHNSSAISIEANDCIIDAKLETKETHDGTNGPKYIISTHYPSKNLKKNRRASSSSSAVSAASTSPSASFSASSTSPTNGDTNGHGGSFFNRIRFPYRSSEVELFTSAVNFADGNEAIHEDHNDDIFLDT